MIRKLFESIIEFIDSTFVAVPECDYFDEDCSTCPEYLKTCYGPIDD